MARPLSRTALAFVSLLTLAGLGCATIYDSRGKHYIVAKGLVVVVVGPQASDLNVEELHIRKDLDEVALWVHKLKGKNLFIEFDEEVFESMTRQSNGRWRVNCQKRHCYSDEIKLYYDKLEDKPKNKHKYYQIVEDATSREVKDGIIIIDP